MYFALIVAVSLSDLTPISPAVMLPPLLIILSINAFKEVYEDWGRHASDRLINDSATSVYSLEKRHWQRPVKWRDVTVGSIVQVRNGEDFPADLLLMSSSDAHGVCYVNTANLDGESNLKRRSTLPALTEVIANHSTETLQSLPPLSLEYDHPNKDLDSFNGALTVGSTDKVGVGLENVLLRGSRLENTHSIYGMVVYTGPQTKLFMNATRAPSKRSDLDIQLNYLLAFGLVLQQILIGISIVYSNDWFNNLGVNLPYLSNPEDPLPLREGIDLILPWLTFLVLYGGFAPVTLFISLEGVRAFQMYFMRQDVELYDPISNTRAKPRTSNLNEELGRVEFLFSDKTGTLTDNKMILRRVAVAGGQCYSTELEPPTGFWPGEDMRSDFTGSAPGSNLEKMLFALSVCGTVIPFHPEVSPEENAPPPLQKQGSIAKLLAGLKRRAGRGKIAAERAAKKRPAAWDDPNSEEDVVVYFGESPDETSFAGFARSCGLFLFDRTPESVSLARLPSDVPVPNFEAGSGTGAVGGGPSSKWLGENKLKHRVLHTLAFTADRKRMSVIVEDEASGKKVLYTKGADSVMVPRLAGEDHGFAMQHVDGFARSGLRTLVFGYRELADEEYEVWRKEQHEASLSLVNRTEMLASAADGIEKDLEFLGVTGVEDKLQDGVPETISALLRAGIRVWVLTGDKMATAIAIGYSSALLTQEMTLSTFRNSDDYGDILQRLKSLVNSAESGKQALVMDGSVFDRFNAGSDSEKAALARAADAAASVIVCRASPLQKARAVELVRHEWGRRTMAIGDGANDVTMIQTAHVGVGIQGSEGRQAVNASDYAIGRFRMLQRLLFVHGTYSLDRLGKLISYSFYKAILGANTLFSYNFLTGWSGTIVYDPFMVSFFTLFFTSAPVFVYAVGSNVLNASTLLAVPELYRENQKGWFFSTKDVMGWFLAAFLHGYSVFWIPILAFSDGGMVAPDGQSDGMQMMGTTMFWALLAVSTFVLMIDTPNWTLWHHAAYWGSLIGYGVFMVGYTAVFSTMVGVVPKMLKDPRTWGSVVLATWVVLGSRLAWKYYDMYVRDMEKPSAYYHYSILQKSSEQLGEALKLLPEPVHGLVKSKSEAMTPLAPSNPTKLVVSEGTDVEEKTRKKKKKKRRSSKSPSRGSSGSRTSHRSKSSSGTRGSRASKSSKTSRGSNASGGSSGKKRKKKSKGQSPAKGGIQSPLIPSSPVESPRVPSPPTDI